MYSPIYSDRETTLFTVFCEIGFRNNPPKSLLTVESRQHTAIESGGSFFGQNDSLVAISTDGFVVTQDAQEEIGNAAGIDFVGLSERVLHLRIRHSFCFWIRPSIVRQYLPKQETFLVLGDLWQRINKLPTNLQNTAALPTPILSLNLVQTLGGSHLHPVIFMFKIFWRATAETT